MPKESNNSTINNMLIGGMAGIISRSCTAPIELYKIQLQNQYIKEANIRNVIQKEGVRYLWKGNLTNCMRVFPQLAINFAVFEKSKSFFNTNNELLNNFSSGALAGMVSMSSMYPLETIRTRLSLQMNKSHYKGPINALKKMSFKGLYGGLGISLLGFGPFNALNFMFFYQLKKFFNKNEINEKLGKFLAGGISGMASLTITYPTDLLRKHYQMTGFNSNVPKYDGILDGFHTIIKNEGMRGLYRGLLPAYIRIFPCLGIQFWCLEKGKELLK